MKKVGRNKSALFRQQMNITTLPELRKALFRPTIPYCDRVSSLGSSSDSAVMGCRHCV